jgi:uncharacterized protein YbaR (Trm112 family)
VIADNLASVIVCPKSKQAMIYFPRGEADRDEADGFFMCPASRLRYRIDGNVPVFLVEEATELAAAEVERLVARARELKLRVP